jgi:hypothetical protein
MGLCFPFGGRVGPHELRAEVRIQHDAARELGRHRVNLGGFVALGELDRKHPEVQRQRDEPGLAIALEAAVLVSERWDRDTIVRSDPDNTGPRPPAA